MSGVFGLYKGMRAPTPFRKCLDLDGGGDVFGGALPIFWRFGLGRVYAVGISHLPAVRRGSQLCPCVPRSAVSVPAPLLPLRPIERMNIAHTFCAVYPCRPAVVSSATLSEGRRRAIAPAPHPTPTNNLKGIQRKYDKN